MDSIDQTAKLIKQQADSIENIVVDQLSTLYSERRRARKLYQEEQNWLNNQFQQVSKIIYVMIRRQSLTWQIINKLDEPWCNYYLNFLLFIHVKLTDDITRKKMEYQKNLEMYKLMRSRFEEYYVKCKCVLCIGWFRKLYDIY